MTESAPCLPPAKRDIDERAWLEDVLRRIPQYELGKKDFTDLLPGNWSPDVAK